MHSSGASALYGCGACAVLCVALEYLPCTVKRQLALHYDVQLWRACHVWPTWHTCKVACCQLAALLVSCKSGVPLICKSGVPLICNNGMPLICKSGICLLAGPTRQLRRSGAGIWVGAIAPWSTWNSGV